MAIADAEPKKGEVDNTSTGSSSGTNKDMKKLTHGPVKFSSLKDFSFSVSDVWDDLNICIFLDCCHANIAELRDHNCAEENKVWEKIAKSGLERAGSISCFNVNYCLELARCLKNFVNKNQTKMMDNEIFKVLYDNVVDLLPHFEPSSAKVPRRRSGSQDKSKAVEHSKPASSQDSSEIVVEPFKSPLDSRSALKKISTVLSKFDPDDLMKSNARSAVWKEVRSRTCDSFGLHVNPKAFIEGYKDSVISTIKSTPGAEKDPQLRAKIFLKMASDMLPYFDYIAPKTVKKSDFLLPEVEIKESTPPKSEPKKRKIEACVLKRNAKPRPWSKRRRRAASRNHVTSETPEAAEDPPAEDPVNIPEPSGVNRNVWLRKKRLKCAATVQDAKKLQQITSPAPRTYQRRKRTAEDDPLSFLDDWTTSLEENDAGELDETELDSKDNEYKPEEKPDEKVDEQPISQNQDVVPAKRVRRARMIQGTIPEEPTPTPKKILPTRQRTKRTVAEPTTASSEPSLSAELEKKPILTTPPVPAASISATTAGPLVPIKPKMIPQLDISDRKSGVDGHHYKVSGVSGQTHIVPDSLVKEPSPFRPPAPVKVVETITEDTSDSEIEDVPLIGNHFRVHRGEASDKPRRANQSKSENMNPVVRLEKMDVSLSVVPSKEVARPKLRPGRPPKRPGSSREASPVPARRRGRPPKNPNNTTATVRYVKPPQRLEPYPSRRELPPSRRDPPPSTSTSSALVRPSRSQPLVPCASSGLTARSYEPTIALNGQVARPEEYALRPSVDINPPEWFEKFVLETRKQEMWKVHQLMKMQNELLAAESSKRNVLEKILAALSERYDRH